MEDEYHQTGGSTRNWWEPSRDQSESSMASSSSFGWPQDHRTSLESVTVSGSSVAVSGDSENFQAPNSSVLTTDPKSLQIMGLEISSLPFVWNNQSLHDESGRDGAISFTSMLQEEINRPASSSFSMDHHHQRQPHGFDSYTKNYGPDGKAPYCNVAVGTKSSARPSFFPSMAPPQMQSEKSRITVEKARDSGTAGKLTGREPGNKRPRNETPASAPAFKVRKQKMGDRINALQQLVSPFGKTDAASVLSEAIEYIKFLHQQVSVLSTPYMNSNGAHTIQHQQVSPDESRDLEGPNLRIRGLCLVPMSSTFPVAHETPADFWTPNFAGTFR